MCGFKRDRLSAARLPWVVERMYWWSSPISCATFPQAAMIAGVESVRVPSCERSVQHEMSPSMNMKTYHIKQNSVGIEYLRWGWHCQWGYLMKKRGVVVVKGKRVRTTIANAFQWKKSSRKLPLYKTRVSKGVGGVPRGATGSGLYPMISKFWGPTRTLTMTSVGSGPAAYGPNCRSPPLATP